MSSSEFLQKNYLKKCFKRIVANNQGAPLKVGFFQLERKNISLRRVKLITPSHSLRNLQVSNFAFSDMSFNFLYKVVSIS